MPALADAPDITRLSFWAQPPHVRDEAFTYLRRESPLFWSGPAESDLLPPELNTRGFWSLTKYADIQFASRNPKIFSSAEGVTMEDMPPDLKEFSQSFIAMDAPRHTQLRGITMDAFKPRNMRKLSDWVRGHAKELIDEMAPLGSGDFAELVSQQLPARIFKSFFGLGEGEQHQAAVRAGQELLSWNDPSVTGGLAPAEHYGRLVGILHETARELADERRAHPTDDLITWMVQAEWEGEQMSDAEIASFFVLLAVAANDTTRHASAGAIYAMTQFPDQARLLAEDVDGRVETAVDEVLRWVAPLIHMRRTAIADCELRGQQIKAGDKVVLWYCSGNRDEEHWGNPFEFDILRTPNRHQAFGGGGPHFCLGNALAREMLSAMLSEVYTRIPDIQAPEPEFVISNFINGINKLPATWTPEER